ncbi:uncharacterized protein Z518_00360 [Rhinocladiella mackenziei CBS 650.93]|uniref:FAD-binding domain-containing protein n=1 Tax=Rhinocladiella mackenziei CBS 650.93 TaxID=1442369 RepID=A0A0D2J0R5_9EURO|nr:uncharacterized protein Z518_00360 [Rhinocladiella mackenziei CBS 650.93]KIX09281.1 hypothetical protein Z518_00360 [Rhinocladiella mackenziei CBS 650.93]
MPFSIAIVGAGPAGLTLARLLQVANVDVSITIFEHDASPTSRLYQGGTLDLHTDTGLAALKKAGLWEEALKHLRYDGEELSFADENATIIVHKKHSSMAGAKVDYERPEIDREILKGMLLNSVKPEMVQWGKTLRSIEPTNGILTFRDGTTAGPFDLVVGADGAWSKVRHVLTDIRPHYAGMGGFESVIENPDRDYPKISKMVGRGSYFSFSDGKAIVAQRMGDESIKVSQWSLKEENYPSDLMASCGSDEEKLKEMVLENYRDWACELREVVRASTNLRPRSLYELPVGHFWDHRKGYTLIGDSASLMTPFTGEGVNKAMKDALELAEVLETAVTRNGSMDEAVEQYEQVMFPRAQKIQQRTMHNKNAMFRGGPVQFMIGMVDVITEESGIDLKKGWLSWIPIKTIMWCCLSLRQVIGGYRRKLRDLFSRR